MSSTCPKCRTFNPHADGCLHEDATCTLVADAFARGIGEGIDLVRHYAKQVQYTYSIPWDRINQERPKS